MEILHSEILLNYFQWQDCIQIKLYCMVKWILMVRFYCLVKIDCIMRFTYFLWWYSIQVGSKKCLHLSCIKCLGPPCWGDSIFYLSNSNSFKWDILCLFFIYFVSSIWLLNASCYANDWIWTADLCQRKQPLYQLCYNHCPFQILFNQNTFAVTGNQTKGNCNFT